MSNRDLIKLYHMLDSAQAISGYIKGKERKDIENNRLVKQAIIREFEIIGEAASTVSNQLKENFPAIPWKEMIGMRNRLIHAYFDINYDIVWKTTQEALPKSIKDLSEAINSLS